VHRNMPICTTTAITNQTTPTVVSDMVPFASFPLPLPLFAPTARPAIAARSVWATVAPPPDGASESLCPSCTLSDGGKDGNVVGYNVGSAVGDFVGSSVGPALSRLRCGGCKKRIVVQAQVRHCV
jgi:hypothetical protein